MLRFLVRAMVVLGILACLPFLLAGWLYYSYVVDAPGEQLTPEYIQSVIAQESPIFDASGERTIGVLFDSKHRIYVPFDELPEAWIQAITAAEDQRFFDHNGLDPKGIARAMWQNIKAGRVVAGGSTLTQQTAKNLYYRPDRSLKSKAREALNALRLEHHYTKKEILEFYSNQFHVNGNGRGLGIAALYFFDKEVSELTIQECAFLAGMVKGPDNYNPFIKRSKESRSAAVARAERRLGYVLKRMVDMGHLTQKKGDSFTNQAIPFNQGRFRFERDVIVEEVARRLSESPFTEIFAVQGIDNPSTAGLNIKTTIDGHTQISAQYGLRHHLTEVGSALGGATFKDFLVAPSEESVKNLDKRGFFTGKVTEKNADSLTLDVGGQTCTLDSSSLKRMANVLAKARDGRRRTGKMDDVLSQIKVGNSLQVSHRGDGICDGELSPDLQGAVLAVQSGKIVAMVGGTNNLHFNRALYARRQLGSVWKTVIYGAALHLGWTPIDRLDNHHNAFPFEGIWYYPRAAHNASEVLSLAGAGIHSENRASVWLLVHLTDHLNVEQLTEVARMVGLGPKEEESRESYIQRIRDDYGVISTSKWLKAIAFHRAKRDISHQMEDEKEALFLRSLLYGHGYDKEKGRIQLEHNQKVAAFNYKSLMTRAELCREAYSKALNHQVAEEEFTEGGMMDKPLLPEGLEVLSLDENKEKVNCGAGLGGEQLVFPMTTPIPPLWLDGRISDESMRKLERLIQRYTLVFETRDPYELDWLVHHPDFQLLINMRYIAAIARKLGVNGDLPPVLSLPLGAVETSLAEAVQLYSGLVSGQWVQPGKEDERYLRLIEEITDRSGNVLYIAEPLEQAVADPVAGRMLSNILRNVVIHGTGRRAKGKVKIGDVNVPLLGKTGTTNNYKNATFCGIAPASVANAWSLEEGVVIAAYVGYDEPRSMSRGSTKLSGASGALPVWISTANGAAESGLLGRPDTHVEWDLGSDFHRLSVDATTGLPTEDGKAETWIHDDQSLWGQEPTARRRYTPIQLSGHPDPDLLKGTLTVEGERQSGDTLPRIQPVVNE